MLAIVGNNDHLDCQAYGKITYLSTTFKRVPRGTEGAVSLEGTLAGICAALVVGLFPVVSGSLISIQACGVCIVAAFVANWIESVLGATIQGKFAWATNDAVNVLNITIGSSIALCLAYYLQLYAH